MSTTIWPAPPRMRVQQPARGTVLHPALSSQAGSRLLQHWQFGERLWAQVELASGSRVSVTNTAVTVSCYHCPTAGSGGRGSDNAAGGLGRSEPRRTREGATAMISAGCDPPPRHRVCAGAAHRCGRQERLAALPTTNCACSAVHPNATPKRECASTSRLAAGDALPRLHVQRLALRYVCPDYHAVLPAPGMSQVNFYDLTSARALIRRCRRRMRGQT